MRACARPTALVLLWAVAACAADWTAMLAGAGQDYAAAVTTDRAGNSYVAGLTYSRDFPVTPGTVQTSFGGTSDAFVAKLSPDGKVIWATFLGGILDDAATGVAVDAAGNVIVSGYTRSQDFPVAHALQATLNGGASDTNFDAFVAKLDPTGAKLLYSTFLGGPDWDLAAGLALDAAGNAYVAGTVTNSTKPGIFVKKLDAQGALVYSYFHPSGSAAAIAVDAAGSVYVTGVVPPAGVGIYGSGTQIGQALVLKLTPDGSQAAYETSFGGSGGANAMAIAVAPDGAAVVGGVTASVNFPLVSPLQSELGARPVWKSGDSGATWNPTGPVPFAFPQALVEAPDGLYAATSDAGVARSTDAGATWTPVNHGIAGTRIGGLAADPAHSGTLFAGTAATPGTVYKSIDGGANWTAVDSRAASGVSLLIVDRQDPRLVYAQWQDSVLRRSTDGGATWTNTAAPLSVFASLVADPAVSGSLWAYSQFIYGGSFGTPTPPYLWHSADAGATWTRLSSPAPVLSGPILIDPSTKPSTLYLGVSWRSDDGGATWVALPRSTVADGGPNPIAIGSGGILYAMLPNTGLFLSRDRGETWVAAGTPVFQATALLPLSDGATLLALARNAQTTGFVTKLTPDGRSILFSTFLGGTVSFAAQTMFAAEPSGMTWQNGVAGISLDRHGRILAAGATRASDFPLAGGTPCDNRGAADAFVATLAPDGSRLLSAACLGGTQDDGALAVTTDRNGGFIAVGQTWSQNFGDALLWRIDPAALSPPRHSALP